MAAASLPDDIVYNIVALLPAKPLLRFRCVSKYWNHILTQPDFFTKVRSRKTIILPLYDTIHLIDNNVPTHDSSNSIVQRCYPIRRKLNNIQRLTVFGTFKGIVLLADSDIITLYNPLTGVSKNLQQPPGYCKTSALGFGHDATTADLKIVRFRPNLKSFQVYSFKEGSWNWRTLEYKTFIKFEHEVGHFINGFLYWIAYNRSVLIAINLSDLFRSQICLPYKINRKFSLNLLGTMNGCLCSLQQISNSGFDMWVMKEHGKWSKIYSLELPLINEIPYNPLRILDSRRILMVDPTENLIIYDTLKKSHETFNIPMKGVHARAVHALEYVESLVSPSDIVSRLERRNKMLRLLKETEEWKVRRGYSRK